MAIKAAEIVYLAVGFILVGILTPIGLGTVYGTITGNTTAVNSAVMVMFQVLLPILYIVSAGLYFLPKIGKD